MTNTTSTMIISSAASKVVPVTIAVGATMKVATEFLTELFSHIIMWVYENTRSILTLCVGHNITVDHSIALAGATCATGMADAAWATVNGYSDALTGAWASMDHSWVLAYYSPTYADVVLIAAAAPDHTDITIPMNFSFTNTTLGTCPVDEVVDSGAFVTWILTAVAIVLLTPAGGSEEKVQESSRTIIDHTRPEYALSSDDDSTDEEDTGPIPEYMFSDNYSSEEPHEFEDSVRELIAWLDEANKLTSADSKFVIDHVRAWSKMRLGSVSSDEECDCFGSYEYDYDYDYEYDSDEDDIYTDEQLRDQQDDAEEAQEDRIKQFLQDEREERAIYGGYTSRESEGHESGEEYTP